jgi:hypothetical protein
MSAWDNSHWVDNNAQILNVFAGGQTTWIEFRYISLWTVGWRRIVADTTEDNTRILQVASDAKQSGTPVRLRVTNGGEITAIQTL